jgi:bifunctional non-homologous end joining protein LigD
VRSAIVPTPTLARYQAKRDFSKTPEPRGRSKVVRSKRLRFVIQKHAARRLHYDLRLELDGVFKSWAVTKGPSLDPKDKRLAVEVEDHPLDYGDFEGTIPRGQYGGGTVQLWDRGYWEPEGPLSAAQMIRKGDLKFRLEGTRLKGEWVLVRMRDRGNGNRHNWLLIKHHDAAERPGKGDVLLGEDRSVASGRSMTDIAAGRGRTPQAFMLARASTGPAAVWNSKPRQAARRADVNTGERMERKRKTSSGATVKATPQRAGAARAARPSAKSAGPSIRDIAISHPEKPLWPAAGGEPAISKLELAEYYDSVAAWMLPHVRERPCSIVRAPEGIAGERFFQRHAMRGNSPFLELVKVSGHREPYLEINQAEGLIAAAQLAAVELHPWNNAPGDPALPGRFVFDLDPAPDVGFERVIEAACELKTRLEQLQLVPFCKTTGGKGMHVVVPFRVTAGERLDWPGAKAIAREICARMVSDSPDKYLLSMAKAERVGKIFLDYLRNDDTATAVAPLSPRARQGAPVSMPLSWSQVRKALDPMKYTVRTAAAQLKKSKPWEGYAQSARPLRAALKRLEGGKPVG